MAALDQCGSAVEWHSHVGGQCVIDVIVLLIKFYYCF